MPVTCTVATTTWNSVDLIGAFLAHYRALGLQRALVMDFDSTDGTRDVLTSARWRGFVELVPFPGIAQLDSSNILLALCRERQASEWCLFCDPDELLVAPGMSLACLADDAIAGVDWLAIPRFNMTGPASQAMVPVAAGSHVDALTLRIHRKHARQPEVERWLSVMTPPWIFSNIMDKVVVRPARVTAIGEGDHVADSPQGATPAPPGLYLVHYPFRSWDAFRAKVEMARIGFAENPQQAPGHAWQVRRWVELADAGTLREEYLQQFVSDAHLDGLLADGTIVRELAVARLHHSLHDAAET